MKLYNFMQDDKWFEDVGHILIGLSLPFYGWWREHRQWPPGDVWYRVPWDEPAKEYVPLDRVADSYRDFLGYAIGSTIRAVVLVGLLVWRW